MIKVNLLRNRAGDTQTNTRLTSTAVAAPTAEGANEQKELLMKMLFIFAFVGGLMWYEKWNLDSIRQEQNELAATLAELQSQVEIKAKEVEGVKDIEQQAKELEDKLKILTLLSKLRLREVKTLDFMQSSIPDKVWLRQIGYQAVKESPIEGRFRFEGKALTTDDLGDFVKRLDTSAYLNNVIVTKNQEISENRAGLIREFTFTADVENRN